MTVPISMLIAHFIGDFLLQSDWMAVNKSKNIRALTAHCIVYSMCFIPLIGFGFATLVFLTHLFTDAFTSKLTSYLWQKEKRHWFFVVIGADQLIHFITLSFINFLYLRHQIAEMLIQ